MKKIFKFLLILFVLFIVLCAGVLLTLKLMFPMEKIKAQLQEQVKSKLNREIDFKDFSFSFNGINIKDFALSEKTTFKDGTFISAAKAHAEIDLKALLHKQIKIETVGLENLTVNIIKDKEGKFNFDDLISQGQTSDLQSQPSKETPLIDIKAKQIYTKDSVINFTNEETSMKFSINNLNIQIDNFALNQDFPVLISCLSKIKTPAFTLDPVNFKMVSQINLSGLDLPKAKAEITDFTITYDTTALNLTGLIADFTNPQINLTGSLSGIDSKLANHFYKGEITSFSVPLINMILSAKINLEQGLADISQAKASIGNSFIKTRASVDYSKADIGFLSNTDISVSLDEIASIAKEALDSFELKGVITGNIKALQDKNLKVQGKLDFKDIGAQILKQKLEDTNGTLIINSLEDIKTNKWSGLLSKEPWNLTLAYKKGKNTDIDLSFYMKKFILEDINFETLFSSEKDKQGQPSSQTLQKESSAQSSLGADLYNLKADILIDKIENNILTANNFVINTDIKDFDLSFAKAQGNLDFSTQDVEIRDIDKLMNSSKLLKIMFTSVKLVQKAFNFAKLDNSSITNGIIKCSMLKADYVLKDGVVNILKSDIDSDLTVVKTIGKADLLKETIDMKIQAQLGKTGSNGFKPLVIRVNGPLSDPSYKLDVLSSLTSIVKNSGKEEESIAGKSSANIANTAGSVIKNIGSLFKNK